MMICLLRRCGTNISIMFYFREGQDHCDFYISYSSVGLGCFMRICTTCRGVVRRKAVAGTQVSSSKRLGALGRRTRKHRIIESRLIICIPLAPVSSSFPKLFEIQDGKREIVVAAHLLHDREEVVGRDADTVQELDVIRRFRGTEE